MDENANSNGGSGPSDLHELEKLINPTQPQAEVKLPAEPNRDLSAKMSNSFQDIFSAKKPKLKESAMMETTLSKNSLQEKLQPILGSAPELEKTIEEQKIIHAKKRLRLTQFIFGFLVLASLASIFYFYSQVSPKFDLLGQNPAQRLNDSNLNLHKLQTDLNKYRYLNAQMALNEFSYQTDRFFGNVKLFYDPAMTAAKKAKFLINIEAAKKAMPELLADIRSNLNQDLSTSTYRTGEDVKKTDSEVKAEFENDLRQVLRDDLKELPPNPTAESDLQNIRLIDNTIKLVGNDSLFKSLKAISIDSFQKDLEDYQADLSLKKEADLRKLIGEILVSTKSDLAIVTEIKQKRIPWSTTIAHIENETRNVDGNYGQTALYENLGGIRYTGYEFDTGTNKIVLSGSTKTLDGSNFTLISNLIDQFNQSIYFEDAQMRAFSKNKTGDETKSGYSAHFKIDLLLGDDEFSDADKAIELNKSQEVKNGIKR